MIGHHDHHDHHPPQLQQEAEEKGVSVPALRSSTHSISYFIRAHHHVHAGERARALHQNLQSIHHTLSSSALNYYDDDDDDGNGRCGFTASSMCAGGSAALGKVFSPSPLFLLLFIQRLLFLPS